MISTCSPSRWPTVWMTSRPLAKLTVATSSGLPPYECIDDDGNIVGTDILACQWMAEQLGVELEVQPMAFDACLAAVGQGDVDMMVFKPDL